MISPRSFQVGSSLLVRPIKGLCVLTLVLVFTCLQGNIARAQKKSKLEIVSPIRTAGQQLVATGGSVTIDYKVHDEDIDSVRFKIDAPHDGSSGSANFKKGEPHSLDAKLFKGKNTIQLFGFTGSEPVKTATASLVIFCTSGCLGQGGQQQEGPKGSTQTSTGKPSAVKIVKPEGGESVTDVKSVDRTIVIDKKANVGTLMIDVINADKSIDHQIVKKFDETETVGIKTVTLRLAKGENLVSVYSLDHLGKPGFQDSVKITCNGPKCAGPDEKVVADAEDEQKPKGTVTIVTPENKATYTDSKTVPFSVTVARKEDASKNVKKLLVTVLNEGKPIIQQEEPFTVTYPDEVKKPGEISLKTLKIGKGENKVEVFDPDNRKTDRAEVTIQCKGDCGGKTDAKDKLSVAVAALKDDKGTYQVRNVSTLDSVVTVPKGVTKIRYDVFGPGEKSYKSAEIPVENTSDKPVEIPVSLKFFSGVNVIRIYDVAHAGGDNDASLMVECKGDTCATDLDIATIKTNSRFTRAIVGMEQAGGSSAESKISPFLDLFFFTPILFRPVNEFVEVPKKDSNGQPLLENGKPVMHWVRRSVGADGKPLKRPLLGTWGEVRLSTTPQQTSSFAVLPSNFVNQLTDPTKAVELVQSFDFLAGLEGQAFPSNGWHWTLIPGIKQHTSLWFTAAFGAISPLSAKRESAQLFIIPPDVVPAGGGNPGSPADPRREEFIRRFGNPPPTAKYVGFVPLERDRFFRQYYGGIRLKTHYCDDEDCRTYRNNFPSVLDVAVGQNEAVTGGTFKSEVRDAAGNLTGKRRNWVLRVDGFFPMPFREANFLYLYGTALMKIGGGGVRIQNPLFLDQPASTIQITDPAVYIPLPDFQPTRVDRDYFKLGIGVNLNDLFNRNKPR